MSRRAGPGIPLPGEHGGDAARVATVLGIDVSALLDLSMSLNPFAPDPAAIVARHLDGLGRYPDPGPATAALARAMNVDPDRLLLTNGGAEAIALVARAVGRGRVDEPEFALYRRHLDEVSPAGIRFRSNPHNPSGLLAGADERAGVWDEAFYPLATGRWTRGDADQGAWVVGSLTKLLACPGLRAGYVVGPDAQAVSRLQDRQPEWSVNAMVAEALPELLATVELAGWASSVRQARGELVQLLAGHGLEAAPSDANWVLLEAPGLRAALVPYGVLVRDCSSFGLAGISRIAVPHPADLDRLDDALERAGIRTRHPHGRAPRLPLRPSESDPPPKDSV